MMPAIAIHLIILATAAGPAPNIAAASFAPAFAQGSAQGSPKASRQGSLQTSPQASATAGTGSEDPRTAAERVQIGFQIAFFASAGWLIATPTIAAFAVFVGGVLPAGFSPLILVPLAPLLFAAPPLMVLATTTLSGLGTLSPFGIFITTAAAGAASAGAALFVGGPVLVRLLLPPQNPQNPSVFFRTSYSLAVATIWLVPAIAAGLAGGLVAPFFMLPLKGDE